MKKTFDIKLSKSDCFSFNVIYPNFNREGLAALFPILDWIVWVASFLFFLKLFGTQNYAFSIINEQSTLSNLYTFVVVLFAVQLVRFIIGGIGHYPKTAFDVAVLVFVAAVVISILLSSSQSSSVFGVEGVKIFSGVSNFALLLLYYLLVSQTITSTFISLRSILFFTIIPFLLSSLNIVGYSLQGIELGQNANYVLFLFPLFFLIFLSSKSAILKTISFVVTAAAILIVNFNSYYISLSLFISIFISTIIFLGLRSDYVFTYLVSLCKDLKGLFKNKGVVFSTFLKRNWKILLFVPVYLYLFIGSTVNTVEFYTLVYFEKFKSNFNSVKISLSGIKELLFGVGLTEPSEAFVPRIFVSYGLLGVVGLVLLVSLFAYYSVRAIRALKTDFEQIAILAGSFTGVLMIIIFGIFVELPAPLYILFWLFIGIGGIVSTKALYKQKYKYDSVTVIKRGKYKNILNELRYIGLIIILAGSVFLIQSLS
ncbi:hypothetical protein JW796_02620 [Candidatus Dojkabacteria bacterium]|nr:hypothetical protein [Candidatus Dojkabacteria bacterium]